MPANNPGSLSPKQYADVPAYLLAADCYPVGDKSFPTDATPALKQTELHPIQGAKGEHPDSNMPGERMKIHVAANSGVDDMRHFGGWATKPSHSYAVYLSCRCLHVGPQADIGSQHHASFFRCR
jgi:hypothetical protein